MLVNTSLTGLLTDVVLQQGDLYFSAELLHKSITGGGDDSARNGKERCVPSRRIPCTTKTETRRDERRNRKKREKEMTDLCLIFASKNLFSKINGRTRILWQTHDAKQRLQRNKAMKKAPREM